MRTFVLVAACVLAGLAGVLAFFAAGKIAVYLDPAARESHLAAFMVAIVGVAVAVASAFPILGRGVPWARRAIEALDRPS